MWSPLRILLILMILMVSSGPAGAQDTYLESDPDSALAVKLAAIPGTPLTLDEAFALAADHATTIQEAAGNLLAAEGAVRREKGGFDPELFAGVERSGDERMTNSPFAGADILTTDRTRVSGGARITLPIGTELEASLNTTREETNSSFNRLDPFHQTFGVLTLRQPLLSGFGPSARGNLSSAQRAREAAQARYNDAVLAVAAEVETAYWDIYAAERDLGVQQVIRDRAEALLNEARLRQSAGLVGPNQVANARVFLAQQELAVLDGEERLDQLSDRMASLLGVRPSGDQVRFRPVNAPPGTFPILPVEDLVTEAIRSNHELIAANATLEQIRAQARAAAWDALPELDVIGSLGGNGLAGKSGPDSTGPGLDEGFSETWSQVRNRNFPTWSVGLELTVPIGFREGRGERDRLRGQAAAAEQQYLAQARSLEESVRTAHRELLHGTRRLEAAENGVDASLEQVRIGLVEYRNGRTTAFELVRLGADLADAQRSYSEALVRTAKAAAELRHLTSGAYPDGLSQ